MELIREVARLRELADDRRSAGNEIGFVPTMGALHEGHASLIRRAREDTGFVVVSIFVNPLQFGEGEDFERYPRDEERDLTATERLGVDAVWAPSVEDMFPPGVELPAPDPGPVGDMFEGAARPGHFAGVLKVVHRLFDVIGPCAASFGWKDAQQLFLIERMVEGLALPIRITRCPTVREPDGLAVSSRNAFLDPDQRTQATCLFLGLSEAASLARSGERDAAVIAASMAREIGATPLAALDYAAVVDEATFEPVQSLPRDRLCRGIVAARFADVRLIDNVLLPEPV
ncbi:MAG: pantoate--beta-alanine ligase [Actinomycetota bacterium]|nr:pantoate--beta-alanine ligase [Actinomycetota bacterium]